MVEINLLHFGNVDDDRTANRVKNAGIFENSTILDGKIGIEEKWWQNVIADPSSGFVLHKTDAKPKK